MRGLLTLLLGSLVPSSLAAAAAAAASSPPSSTSEYHEQLNLRPLPLNSLLASFNFRSNTSLADFEAHNFRLFPRSLAQILQYAGTRELHLRFTLGRWDAERWGARPWDGTREGGTGVELWAWLDAKTDAEAAENWLTLTNALSGLFCASLNFIDETRTIRPVVSFQPDGDHDNATLANLRLLHGVLPHEVVCTENLTPFLKLLPCKGKAGIASLLDGHKLFDASFQSMAIDVRPICSPGGRDCVLEMEQTIDMVLDVDRSKRPRDNPIPRPPPADQLLCDTSKPYHNDETCYPVDHVQGQDWTLSEIFGRTMKGTCPLSNPDEAPVCLHVPNSRAVFSTQGTHEIKSHDGMLRCYTLPQDSDFTLVLAKPEPDDAAAGRDLVQPERPLLYAERSFMGHGQEHGGVQAILTNPSDTEVEFVYMESLPWFMRIYLHTLSTRISSSSSNSATTTTTKTAVTGTNASSIIQEIYYRPALDRTRGTQLELLMRIPPHCTIFLTYDFEKSILRYTEYPPDANRGFDVAAAVITTRSPRRGLNLRTTSLLLYLPTPDFSMPYNVIIFTSTAIALTFGGLYNILVRRLVGADEAPPPVLKAKLAALMGRLRSVKK
ncbi:Subunit of the glycosylphosphatidylinositol transamidase complex-like protein [Purpureocillium takamizusanense]|uniref:Subunit of the glycosylphosphatidylinositol transamidase complex-like protein n=1 Tax=Purpureocillium takamizusanense TaxID=2060973 RepID=A0A9Q8QEB9_9HYPO|nr:Subunit of the glycosylphosphatidylinositol transamidase complex-like protein [Purpureocillium takamizusanense]UNI18045.1 Subunit of the glycosylphosphatidylinositol transamidase complex-like protein [Purpureocillium takamizusanense]